MEPAWYFWAQKARYRGFVDRKNLNKGWGEVHINQNWLQKLFWNSTNPTDFHWTLYSASFCDLLPIVRNSFYTCFFWNVLLISMLLQKHLGEPCWLNKKLYKEGEWELRGRDDRQGIRCYVDPGRWHHLEDSQTSCSGDCISASRS